MLGTVPSVECWVSPVLPRAVWQSCTVAAAGKGHSLAGLWSLHGWSTVEMGCWWVPSLEHSKFWRVLWLVRRERPWELTDCGGVGWGISLFPWSSPCAGSCYWSTTALLLFMLTAAPHTAPQREGSNQGKGWVKNEEGMTKQSQEKPGAAEKHRGCKVQRRRKGGWKAEGSRSAVGRSGRQSGWRTFSQGVAGHDMLYAEITVDLSIINLKVNTALYMIGT